MTFENFLHHGTEMASVNVPHGVHNPAWPVENFVDKLVLISLHGSAICTVMSIGKEWDEQPLDHWSTSRVR